MNTVVRVDCEWRCGVGWAGRFDAVGCFLVDMGMGICG
jgi:hypothetical protein